MAKVDGDCRLIFLFGDKMRFDDMSDKFSVDIRDRFHEEFKNRIEMVNRITIAMHPIIQAQSCKQLCITGMRINSKLNLEYSKWEPKLEGLNELHLILDEHDCYRICSNETSMQIRHEFFRSWDNPTKTLIYQNINGQYKTVECNLRLAYPVLYAIDKLNAMY